MKTMEVEDVVMNLSSDGSSFSESGVPVPILEEEEPVPVRIVKWENLHLEMEKEVKEAAEVSCLPPTSVRILMNAVKWDKSKMLERSLYGESFFQLRDIGIILNPPKPASSAGALQSGMVYKGTSGGTCMACRRMTSPQALVWTACQHRFCLHCFIQYLISEINMGDRSQFQCPYALCTMLLDEETVLKYLPPRLNETYKKLCMKDFVDYSMYRRSCPSVDCNRSCYFDVSMSSKRREIKCDCGTSYCFGCGDQWHYPLSCEQLKKWMNMFEKIPDYLTVTSFDSNSKACPRCSVILTKGRHEIEQSFLCTTCDYRFCWRCLQNESVYSDSDHTCSFECDGIIRPEVMALAKVCQDYVDLRAQFPSNHETPEDETGVAEDNKCAVDLINDNEHGRINAVGVKPKTADKYFETCTKSQQFLGYCYAFAFFLENTCKKLEYLEHMYKLESELVKLITNVSEGKYKYVRIMDKAVKEKRDILTKVLDEGFGADWWYFQNIKMAF